MARIQKECVWYVCVRLTGSRDAYAEGQVAVRGRPHLRNCRDRLGTSPTQPARVAFDHELCGDYITDSEIMTKLERKTIAITCGTALDIHSLFKVPTTFADDY